MVEMKLTYAGEKHCEITHGPSGSKIETDAPKDNQGRGEKILANRSRRSRTWKLHLNHDGNHGRA